jgi:hypothetical protein
MRIVLTFRASVLQTAVVAKCADWLCPQTPDIEALLRVGEVRAAR